MSTVQVLIVRLLPNPPTDPTTFQTYLNGLTITAYDQSLVPVDPNVVTPGTKEWQIGSASVSSSTPLWTPEPLNPLPPLVVSTTPGPTSSSPPVLASTIFQHFQWFWSGSPAVPTPAGLRSVATAIIVVNIDPKAPNPYPEYPSSTYNVRLSLSRGGVTLPDPPIQWSLQAVTPSNPSATTWPVDQFGINELDPNSQLNSITSSSTMYALIPNPPPQNAPSSTTITLPTDGTPPKFEDLHSAIDPVLSAYNLTGATSLASLTVALTDSQSLSIAQAIMNNQAIQQLPVPVPPFPSQTDVKTLEDMYSSPQSSTDSERKQFEGNLAAYHAKTDSAAQKLAPYVFAASAAVYAEIQTTIAQTANFDLPLFNGGSVPVTLTGSNAALNPSFIVPAAYFYALCADHPSTMDAPLRYTDILAKAKSTDYIYQKIKTAQAKGILSSSESPVTSPATTVTDVAAILRLSALSTTSVSGPDPVLSLTGGVATLVSRWLTFPPTTLTGQSSFFTPAEFDSQTYLQVILQVVTKGPYPSSFTDAITTTPLVPVPNQTTLRVLQTSSDLPLITNQGWLTLFQNLATATSPSSIPAWLGNGSPQNQAKAFMTWIQTLFAVKFQTQTSSTASGGNASSLGTDFSSDVLAQFFTLYKTKYNADLDFSSDLNQSNITAILSLPDFSDPALQAWMNRALQTIRALYVLTNITSPTFTSTLQFSYMESLYCRGFTSLESVSIMSGSQFKSALTGTVAYSVSDAIYSNANANGTAPPALPGTGFHPCNPGSLVNCIPPPNLSPLGKIEYLHELLQLSVGSANLGDSVSGRRGPLGNLHSSLANLTTEVNKVDLVNESLESLGSNHSQVHGAVYDTFDVSLPGSDVHDGLDAQKAAAIISQHSSPSPSIAAPAVYDTLKTCCTSPSLPYSQSLDVCRSYLCHLGTNRFDTMRHFRQNITEFPMVLAGEPLDFQKEQWRLPVRFDIALEYLQISPEEYSTLWSAPMTTNLIAQLYGINLATDTLSIPNLLTVSGFTNALGLTYCELLDLWKCEVVKFSAGSSKSRNSDLPGDADFPECPPCCLDGLRLVFPGDNIDFLLGGIAIFVRLWQKLQFRCENPVSMQCLSDIFSVFHAFTFGDDLVINPDFIRQLASLLMLVDLYHLPWTTNSASSTSVGVERTQLLGIWAGPSANPVSWNWALKYLLTSIQHFAFEHYKCSAKEPNFSKIVAENLDELSTLAGFSPTNTWYSTPTCTIRFAEVLAKIYASDFTVGELIFMFTTQPHLEGDDPFPIDKSEDDPLNIPSDEPYRIESLRRKLLKVEISDEDLEQWDWYLVESTLNDAGFSNSSHNGANKLISLAQHFFPKTLSSCGYHVDAEKRRFTTNLPPTSTSPQMWSSPPCDPFHYSYDPGSRVPNNPDAKNEADESPPGHLWTQIPLHDSAVLTKLRAVRQLNAAEILALRNLYFAPRAMLSPFALVFSNFGHAVHNLIEESSERARFDYFRREVALFQRRCEIITNHIAEHIASVSGFNSEEEGPIEREVVWKILTSLAADENIAATSWESDSGAPPTAFMADPSFSGSAFAALLGLIGTGLEGQYETNKSITWMEMRGGLTAFGSTEDDWNTPIPTVIPALDLKPSLSQADLTSFKNGNMLRDGDGKELGGAQAFTITWNGVLLIEKAGHYRFGAGLPCSENQMPNHCLDSSWMLTLGRGHKIWKILRSEDDAASSSPQVSPGVPLQKGTYDMSVTFEQQIPLSSKILEEDGIHRIQTGFQLKYEGPDTDGCVIEVPFFQLMRKSKAGPFRVSEKNVFGTAAQFLNLQYTSTIRDIRRTYQRAFKASLFAYRFRLSAQKSHCDHQSELGYLLVCTGPFSNPSNPSFSQMMSTC